MSNSESISFDIYGVYYDLLYSTKDYAKEAEYVTKIIRAIDPTAEELIELGCGTGNYSESLCRNGYQVTGIEKSERMVQAALSKSIENFFPLVGDVTTFKLNRKFDVAVSLFHVISYLNTNEEVLSCFKNVFEHLKAGGIFIFDIWYTPAVYSQKPETRIRRVENKEVAIIRIAEPSILFEQNVVQIAYEMIIRIKATDELQILKERHTMRHFSTPEIKLIAELVGFTIITSQEFLTAKEPGADTWGVCFVLQKHD
ncbi:MAG: class I SAM-dependent DNA methyltransferase [Segetibacter sp.]